MRFRFLAVLLLSAAPLIAKSVEVPVVYYRLPNGLKVVISESHVAPVVAVAVYYGVGFRVEPKGQTGSASISPSTTRRCPATAWRRPSGSKPTACAHSM